MTNIDKIIYKGHEWKEKRPLGTGYICDECGAICSSSDEMMMTECKPRLAPVEWLGAHFQIKWNKTDNADWPLEVVYKIFKLGETKELDKLLVKESYPKLEPCTTKTGEKYAQIPGIWKQRIKSDAETMKLPVYVVDLDGYIIKMK